MADSRSSSLRIGGCVFAVLLAHCCGAWAQYNSPDELNYGSGSGYASPSPFAADSAEQGGYVPAHARGGYPGRSPNLTPGMLGHMHTAGAAPEVIDDHGQLASLGNSYNGSNEPYAGGFNDECACGGWGCDACGYRPGHLAGVAAVLGRRAIDRAQIYHGVTSFSGPTNRGGTGSFGVEGGVDLSAPLPLEIYGLGWQAGVGGTLANFNGANFTRDEREQLFLTFGMFRRVDWGLQGGLVIDYLREDWYANANLQQLRGEVSWVMPEGTDYGFWFTSSNSHDSVIGTLQTGTALPTRVSERWDVNNLSAFFVRHTFANNAQARVFAGWTGSSDGLLGADMNLPLDDHWSLRNSFTYVLPQQGQLDGGSLQESWNVGIQLVYYPFCGAQDRGDYYRPLFNVANNGNFIVNRR